MVSDQEQPLHQPVLVEEVLTYLDPSPDATVLDCTFGSGGHAKALLNRLGPDGAYVAMDWDPASFDRAEHLSEDVSCEFVFQQGNFARVRELLNQWNEGVTVDAVLADLGWSMDQLRKGEKGLTFERDEFLDMRYNPEADDTAADLLHNASEERLVELFREHGEHKYGQRIAQEIVEKRDQQPIRRSLQLMDLISSVTGAHEKNETAARIFQALRTEVNHELENLDRFLNQIPTVLAEGGRACVISFHSLEDRRVKNAFQSGVENGLYELLMEGPVQPDEDQVEENPSARSAKLRAVERRGL